MPSRFGLPPENAGMVMTFWVPSLTGSSSWDALRSADPSSQPTPYAPHPVSSPYPISRPPPAATAVPAPADRASPAGSSASPPADAVIATARRGALLTTPAVRPARTAARRPACASTVSAPCGHNANTRTAPATSAQPGPASTKIPANARQAANRDRAMFLLENVRFRHGPDTPRRVPVPRQGDRLQRRDISLRQGMRPRPRVTDRLDPRRCHRSIQRLLAQMPPPAIRHIMRQRAARLRVLPHPRDLQTPLRRPRLRHEPMLGQLLLERPRSPGRVHHQHNRVMPLREFQQPRQNPSRSLVRRISQIPVSQPVAPPARYRDRRRRRVRCHREPQRHPPRSLRPRIGAAALSRKNGPPAEPHQFQPPRRPVRHVPVRPPELASLHRPPLTPDPAHGHPLPPPP